MKTIKDLMSLENRIAIITGGAGYLGYSFAETLLELGAHVIIVDKSAKKNSETIKKLKDKNYDKIDSYVCDLSKKKSILNLCQKIKSKYKKIDILINNAAYVGTSDLTGWAVPFLKQSTDCWADALQVNLTAMFELSQNLSDLLKKSKKGSIINISSIYGLNGPDMDLYKGTKMGNPAAYAASKGGVIQLSRWLATNMAPDVRINTVSPGGIERRQNANFQKAYIKKTPLGRMATEEDLKGIIAYLASDLSAYVTGQNFVIDGGWTAW